MTYAHSYVTKSDQEIQIHVVHITYRGQGVCTLQRTAKSLYAIFIILTYNHNHNIVDPSLNKEPKGKIKQK